MRHGSPELKKTVLKKELRIMTSFFELITQTQ